MNFREQFLRLMRFEVVDTLPVVVVEPYEAGVIERWQSEGLPVGMRPGIFLGMDEFYEVPVTFYPLPAFEPVLVAEDDDSFTDISEMGATVRHHKQHPTTFYGHIAHPVKTRADWEVYKQRFQAGTPGRRPLDRESGGFTHTQTSTQAVELIIFPFFCRLGFYALGMERFLTAFYQEPDLIHDMFAFWADFTVGTIRPILEQGQVDVVLFTEDVAGKNGPLVSPRLYQQFWQPHQEVVLSLLRQHGVPLICQWTAGKIDPLLPLMVEQGFNVTWPLERAAGMNAYDVRRKYGHRLALAGNIAISALIEGPQAIDAEIRHLTPLIKDGGFIPALDDMVPLEVPFDHFRYYVEALKRIRI